MQSMVLTLGNGQTWLGTFSSSLTIYFSILPLCGLQLPLRETPCFSPPEHLRSKISYLRTGNVPDLISCIYLIALSKRFTGCVSTWL